MFRTTTNLSPPISSLLWGALAIALGLLAACDSPSIAFTGVPAQRIDVGPSTFSVRVKGNRVESIRISREYLPGESAILGRAAVAMEQASGCVLRKGSLTGDQAIQRARLACGKTQEPAKGETPMHR